MSGAMTIAMSSCCSVQAHSDHSAMQRRTFLRMPLAALAASLAACALRPPELASNLVSTGTVDEPVTAFAMCADHRRLIIVGQRFHYVLDLPPGVGDLFMPPDQALVKVQIPMLYSDGLRIFAALDLTMAEHAPEAARQIASRLGFHPAANGELTKREGILGQQYDASGFDAHLLPHLDPAYRISVEHGHADSNAETHGEPTPLTIDPHGTLTFKGEPVVIIGATALPARPHARARPARHHTRLHARRP